jgi:cell division protein FtsW (lipid II flippase)
LFVQMLAVIGVDPATALSLSLLAYAGSLLWSMVGGVVYLMMKDRRQLSDLEMEASREA